MRDVLNWSDPVLEKFEIDEKLIKSCGWVWWHEDILAISDRPSELHRDEAGRLHNESGPSIAYRDGWKLWHWHGIVVPEEVITEPITTKKIAKEKNAEIRRCMIERYGYGRYMKDVGADLVHQDGTGKLWKISAPDQIAVVEVVNGTAEPDGSCRTYHLSVPPDCKTAMSAVAWTYGMTEKEYRNLAIRT